MPGGRRVRGSVLVDNGRVVARGKTAFADLFKQCLFVLAEPKCEIFVGKAHPQNIFLLAQGKALQPGFPRPEPDGAPVYPAMIVLTYDGRALPAALRKVVFFLCPHGVGLEEQR